MVVSAVNVRQLEMTKETAELVRMKLLDSSGKLDQSIAVLEGEVEPDFLKKYRRLAGQILGLFYIEILRDIFRDYPELEPESIK